MDPVATALLETWFGDWADDAPVPPGGTPQMRLWWGADPEVDADLRRRFGAAAHAAAEGDLDGWGDAPDTCIALVLLLDQIPRNIHRGTAAAFASDAKARATVRAALAAGLDRKMPRIHRSFLYMPLMHSEDLADHALAEKLFGALADEAVAADLARADTYRAAVDFEQRHKALIERFGRYPHRNTALGRASTPEELAWVAEHKGF